SWCPQSQSHAGVIHPRRRTPENSSRSDSSAALRQPSPRVGCRRAGRRTGMSQLSFADRDSGSSGLGTVGTNSGRRVMKIKLGTLLLTSAAFIAPAAAQDAASLLQATDKATGASAVNSVTYSGAGTIRDPGQNFEQNGDCPRAPITSYTATIDYGSKSAKEDYAVDVSKKERGGGLASPHVTNFVSGNYAWGLNPQGQLVPQPAAA